MPNFKKGFAGIAILLLIIQTLVSPIVSLAATNTNSGTEDQVLKLSTENQNVKTGSNFDVHISQTSGDTATIAIPNDISFDKVADNNLKANIKTATFNQDKSEITITWNEDKKDNAADLTLKAEKAGNYGLIGKTTIDGVDHTSNTLLITAESSLGTPSLKSGTVNADIDIAPVNASVQAGQDTVFALNFKVTGSQITYQNANITIDLPANGSFTQDLNELAIFNVVPSYDANAHRLTYHFDTLSAGQAEQVIIKVHTENGVTTDGTQFVAKASFTADNFTGNATDDATVTAKASSSVSVSKAYVETLKNGTASSDPAVEGDTGVWSIKVNADAKDTGLLYFKEGSKIKVVDTIPAGLTYVSDDSGGVYDSAARTVTWEFDAPTIDAQKAVASGDSLFNKTIEVRTTYDAGITEITSYTNTATVSAVDYSDQAISKDATAKTYAGPFGGDVPAPSGTLITPVHYGPKDAEGGVGGDSANPNPSVYDSARLGFSIALTNYTTNSRTMDYDKYEVNYNIDDALNLSEFVINPSDYNPDFAPPDAVSVDPSKESKVDIYVTINGQEQLLAQGVGPGTYKLHDYGIADGTHVSKIRYSYQYRPAGYNNWIYMYYSVESGYTGTISNTVSYDVTGYDVAGNQVSWNNDADMNDSSTLTGERTATIVPKPAGSIPILSSSIKIVNQENGIVQPGRNFVQGQLANDTSSVEKAGSPLEEMLLLPKGVTVDEANPMYQMADQLTWGSATTDGNNEEGTIKIVDSNYNGTGQQLIHVKWNEDSLYPGKSISYFFAVNIAEDAPSTLTPMVYGSVGDANFDVPTQTGDVITNSVKVQDTNDINGNGNVDENLVVSGNKYYILREDKITTSKLVKGDQDTEFSKFGHTSLGGTIDYQLNLTNDGETQVNQMVLMDVLPSVGDLGITDNTQRGSQFTPIMTGPITVPAEWAGKVAITYSTATNPTRDDLTENVLYPETTTPITNPIDAQQPNWMDATSVMDWSQIHSFKITLLDNASFNTGDNIALNFSMQAPTVLDASLTNPTIDEQTRAAWNSFAYASNNLQAVEPERVGVVVNDVPEEPVIHKDVENTQHVDLTNRDDSFDWHVNAIFGNTTSTWTEASITDTINDSLDIQNVTVVDENGTDVTSNGQVNIDGNNISFDLAMQDGSFNYLAGHTYTMTITTKIKDSATDEELAPYIASGGIPNQADLHFGDAGEVIHSEIPTVTPPPEEPVIHKDVENTQHVDLTNRDDSFDWHVNATFGNTTTSWAEASITDTINDLLDIQNVTVVDENGTDVTSNGQVNIDGNNISFDLATQNGDFAYLAGHTYTMTITTKIKDSATDEELAPYIASGGIPNQADLHFGDAGEVIHSEIPTVTPPPEEPVIHKDVENTQHVDLTNRDDSFDWHVNATFGNTTTSWAEASITDTINDLLDIQNVTVVDENGTDVTSNGQVNIDGNNISFDLATQNGDFAYLAGHTYTMTVTTKIKDSTTDAELAPYIASGGIPNQADLHFGNAGEVIHSEIPTVTPPPEEPVIHKDVENVQHLDLTNRDDSFDWHVNATFGNTTTTWTEASITDTINDLLDIQNVTVVDENGTDVTSNGQVNIDGNNISFDLATQNGDFTYLAGHTYTMTITTKIKDSATDEELAPYIASGGIPNQADLHFGNAGEVIHSEIPTVTPPPEEPVIHKDVENTQHVDLTNRDDSFDWHVNAEFGNTTTSWTEASITDTINDLLEIQNVTVVDENGTDVTANGQVNIDGNNISFDLAMKNGDFTYLAGHTYTMTITTKIKASATDEELAPYIASGGIPNQADLHFGNAGEVIHSEIPTVTPPPEEPVIHKDVENVQHLDLTNRDDSFDWHVNATFGNTTTSWAEASITDTINDLLDIQNVTVVDENGTDVTSNGQVNIDGNNISFDLAMKNGDFTYLAGHTYTMTITTKIKDSATDEELAPYIASGGIPNQADLHFGNAGEVIHSEIPTVTPPPEEPVIHKDVEDTQALELTNRDDSFDWHVKTSFGNTTTSWAEASITDTINDLLDIQNVTVVDENGTDVTGNGQVNIDGNNISFDLAMKDGDFTYLAGHTYTMTITTKIKDSATDEELAPYIASGGIPNQADLHFGDAGEVIHSEIPTVTPPPEEPVIHKDVENVQHLDLTNRDDSFDWHVKTSFGNTTTTWAEASITDTINDLLDIQNVTVVDENGTDVTGNGQVNIDGNNISFDLAMKDGDFTYLAGHTYTMTVTTKIKDSATDEELAPYIASGGIPNQADLHFGNAGEVIHSEIPTVTPPTEEPVIHKDVENTQHLDLANRDDSFDWHVKTSFGNTTSSWAQANISDAVNDLLDIQNVTVVDENGTDVTGNGQVNIDGNNVSFDLAKKDGDFSYLAGHTYTMTITTKIKDSATNEELAPFVKNGGIPNSASLTFGETSKTIYSEKPTVTPPLDYPAGNLPHTGDTDNMIWILAGALVLLGTLTLVARRKRNNNA
ncbi:isopeptide-forming domain-containing fimbrial protein [Listeria sp. ILCC796]|uniref:isopeptide-forming domain-containing fimbrial protein n=2 Tax=unclassified Listeria TaxID=2642072 RepID=UPI000B59141C|nr:isopeptide-forming domain-containing fimbrial protein [Listeria sp. ILCC796]